MLTVAKSLLRGVLSARISGIVLVSASSNSGRRTRRYVRSFLTTEGKMISRMKSLRRYRHKKRLRKDP